jgi:hypothetical protein
MSKSLDDALAQGAWSVSGVMFDLDAMHDDEGRPISERRADAMARVGVEMEMKRCPFDDIRKGHWMNVSALAQITRYLNPVLGELEAFRRQLGVDASWDDILASVIDQLSGPAIYLLQQRDAKGPVPAQTAVGHKLAAGMFGVMRGLHERLALGAELPVSVDSFLDLIEELGALMGASEACAGSPQMIRKATIALVEGNAENQLELDPLRIDMARCLALQVQLGIFWRLYDRVHFWSLLRGSVAEHLVPFNDFLTRKLDNTRNDLEVSEPPRPDSNMLPGALETQARQKLAEALNDSADETSLAEDIGVATELLNEPGSAIEYHGEVQPLALNVANYLNSYRLFKETLSQLELELRQHLGYPLDTPIKLGLAVFPRPQALPWYELILGRRLGEDGHLTGNSTGLRIAKSVG